MLQFFNLTFWIWLAETHSPAALTRAYFADWARMPANTHKKND